MSELNSRRWLWQQAAVVLAVAVTVIGAVAAGLNARIDDNREQVVRGWDRIVAVQREVQGNRERTIKINGKLDSIQVRIEQLVRGIAELKAELRGRER